MVANWAVCYRVSVIIGISVHGSVGTGKSWQESLHAMMMTVPVVVWCHESLDSHFSYRSSLHFQGLEVREVCTAGQGKKCTHLSTCSLSLSHFILLAAFSQLPHLPLLFLASTFFVCRSRDNVAAGKSYNFRNYKVLNG